MVQWVTTELMIGPRSESYAGWCEDVRVAHPNLERSASTPGWSKYMVQWVTTELMIGPRSESYAGWCEDVLAAHPNLWKICFNPRMIKRYGSMDDDWADDRPSYRILRRLMRRRTCGTSESLKDLLQPKNDQKIWFNGWLLRECWRSVKTPLRERMTRKGCNWNMLGIVLQIW